MESQVKDVVHNMLKTLECPVCLDVLEDPVSTSCHHQFCRACIHQVICTNNIKNKSACPLCKTKISKRGLTEKPQLKAILQTVKEIAEAIKMDSGIQISPPKWFRQLESNTISSTSIEVFNLQHPSPSKPSANCGQKRSGSFVEESLLIDTKRLRTANSSSSTIYNDFPTHTIANVCGYRVSNTNIMAGFPSSTKKGVAADKPLSFLTPAKKDSVGNEKKLTSSPPTFRLDFLTPKQPIKILPPVLEPFSKMTQFHTPSTSDNFDKIVGCHGSIKSNVRTYSRKKTEDEPSDSLEVMDSTQKVSEWLKHTLPNIPLEETVISNIAMAIATDMYENSDVSSSSVPAPKKIFKTKDLTYQETQQEQQPTMSSSQDPYTFISSQRTPRKPKRGKRAKTKMTKPKILQLPKKGKMVKKNPSAKLQYVDLDKPSTSTCNIQNRPSTSISTNCLEFDDDKDDFITTKQMVIVNHSKETSEATSSSTLPKPDVTVPTALDDIDDIELFKTPACNITEYCNKNGTFEVAIDNKHSKNKVRKSYVTKKRSPKQRDLDLPSTQEQIDALNNKISAAENFKLNIEQIDNKNVSFKNTKTIKDPQKVIDVSIAFTTKVSMENQMVKNTFVTQTGKKPGENTVSPRKPLGQANRLNESHSTIPFFPFLIKKNSSPKNSVMTEAFASVQKLTPRTSKPFVDHEMELDSSDTEIFEFEKSELKGSNISPPPLLSRNPWMEKSLLEENIVVISTDSDNATYESRDNISILKRKFNMEMPVEEYSQQETTKTPIELEFSSKISTANLVANKDPLFDKTKPDSDISTSKSNSDSAEESFSTSLNMSYENVQESCKNLLDDIISTLQKQQALSTTCNTVASTSGFERMEEYQKNSSFNLFNKENEVARLSNTTSSNLFLEVSTTPSRSDRSFENEVKSNIAPPEKSLLSSPKLVNNESVETSHTILNDGEEDEMFQFVLSVPLKELKRATESLRASAQLGKIKCSHCSNDLKFDYGSCIKYDKVTRNFHLLSSFVGITGDKSVILTESSAQTDNLIPKCNDSNIQTETNIFSKTIETNTTTVPCMESSMQTEISQRSFNDMAVQTLTVECLTFISKNEIEHMAQKHISNIDPLWENIPEDLSPFVASDVTRKCNNDLLNHPSNEPCYEGGENNYLRNNSQNSSKDGLNSNQQPEQKILRNKGGIIQTSNSLPVASDNFMIKATTQNCSNEVSSATEHLENEKLQNETGISQASGFPLASDNLSSKASTIECQIKESMEYEMSKIPEEVLLNQPWLNRFLSQPACEDSEEFFVDSDEILPPLLSQSSAVPCDALDDKINFLGCKNLEQTGKKNDTKLEDNFLLDNDSFPLFDKYKQNEEMDLEKPPKKTEGVKINEGVNIADAKKNTKSIKVFEEGEKINKDDELQEDVNVAGHQEKTICITGSDEVININEKELQEDVNVEGSQGKTNIISIQESEEGLRTIDNKQLQQNINVQQFAVVKTLNDAAQKGTHQPRIFSNRLSRRNRGENPVQYNNGSIKSFQDNLTTAPSVASIPTVNKEDKLYQEMSSDSENSIHSAFSRNTNRVLLESPLKSDDNFNSSPEISQSSDARLARLLMNNYSVEDDDPNMMAAANLVAPLQSDLVKKTNIKKSKLYDGGTILMQTTEKSSSSESYSPPNTQCTKKLTSLTKSKSHMVNKNIRKRRFKRFIFSDSESSPEKTELSSVTNYSKTTKSITSSLKSIKPLTESMPSSTSKSFKVGKKIKSSLKCSDSQSSSVSYINLVTESEVEMTPRTANRLIWENIEADINIVPRTPIFSSDDDKGKTNDNIDLELRAHIEDRNNLELELIHKNNDSNNIDHKPPSQKEDFGHVDHELVSQKEASICPSPLKQNSEHDTSTLGFTVDSFTDTKASEEKIKTEMEIEAIKQQIATLEKLKMGNSNDMKDPLDIKYPEKDDGINSQTPTKSEAGYESEDSIIPPTPPSIPSRSGNYNTRF